MRVGDRLRAVTCLLSWGATLGGTGREHGPQGGTGGCTGPGEGRGWGTHRDSATVGLGTRTSWGVCGPVCLTRVP